MKKSLLAITGILAAALFGIRGLAAEPDTLRVFMRAKLDHSQKILEGLTTDDLAAVAKHSQELSLLSHASNWQVLQTEDYMQHSREFRRAADTLTKAARDKNLDGATLAYVSMTMSCVNCHKYVRGVRMANVRAASPLDLRFASVSGQFGSEPVDNPVRLSNDVARDVEAEVR